VTNLEIEELKPSDGIRWAIGSPTKPRGSTWRFWANRKGDFYVSVRSLGGTLKTSLHKDRRCHTAFTKEFEHKLFPGKSRFLDKWELADEPWVAAVQIVTPFEELECFESPDVTPMKWIPAPPNGHVTVVTLFVLSPDYKLENGEPWPGAHGGAQPVGFATTKLRTAFIVHAHNALDEPTNAEIEKYRAKAEPLAKGAPVRPGNRMILFGGDGPGTRFFIELAHRPSPSEEEQSNSA
jgi:hypothetical protein